MHIHPVRLGVALGITHAVFLVAIAVLAAFFRWANEWVHLFSRLYPGYGISIFGIAIGVLWAILAGFALGWLFAVVFNFFAYLDASDDFD